jgi:hypothetical protein
MAHDKPLWSFFFDDEETGDLGTFSEARMMTASSGAPTGTGDLGTTVSGAAQSAPGVGLPCPEFWWSIFPVGENQSRGLQSPAGTFPDHDDARTTVSANGNGGDAVGMDQAPAAVVTQNGDLDCLFLAGQVPWVLQH